MADFFLTEVYVSYAKPWLRLIPTLLIVVSREIRNIEREDELNDLTARSG